MHAKKNTTLELIKLFASYMVVFIHVCFPGFLGPLMETLARFAVPLFFLISGFFTYQASLEKIKKRILHIVVLLIIGTATYTIYNIATLLFPYDAAGMLEYFGKYSDIQTLLKLIVLNLSISADHLWYLHAILYTYVVLYFVTKINLKERVFFIISLALLGLHLLLGNVLSLFGITLPLIIIRNFALMGIPFFSLGMLTRKYTDKLQNISSKLIILCFLTGMAESVLARYLFGVHELYLGSLLVAFSATVTFIKYAEVQYPRFISAFAGCSTYVYIFHVLVGRLLRKCINFVCPSLNASTLFSCARPIIVCILSTLLAYLIIRITHKRSTKKAF